MNCTVYRPDLPKIILPVWSLTWRAEESHESCTERWKFPCLLLLRWWGVCVRERGGSQQKRSEGPLPIGEHIKTCFSALNWMVAPYSSIGAAALLNAALPSPNCPYRPDEARKLSSPSLIYLPISTGCYILFFLKDAKQENSQSNFVFYWSVSNWHRCRDFYGFQR